MIYTIYDRTFYVLDDNGKVLEKISAFTKTDNFTKKVKKAMGDRSEIEVFTCHPDKAVLLAALYNSLEIIPAIEGQRLKTKKT